MTNLTQIKENLDTKFDEKIQLELVDCMLKDYPTVFQIVEQFESYEEMSQDETYSEIFQGYTNNIPADKRVAARLNIVACFKAKTHGFKNDYNTKEHELFYIVNNNGYFKLNKVKLGACLSSSMGSAFMICGLLMYGKNHYKNCREACDYIMQCDHLIA